MKASLDTNVIIHFYRAHLQHILFEVFTDGVFIYEQIRSIELEHHGQDIVGEVDADIDIGKVTVYTDKILKEQGIFRIFEVNVHDNRLLYGAGDLGEVYAISLAQTIGVYSLITDDIKQGGPYMSLLQFDDCDIMPFTFAEILILRYLLGGAEAEQTLCDFNLVNDTSGMNWSFKSQIIKFIKRFWNDPYKEDEKMWMSGLVKNKNIKIKSKFLELKNLTSSQ